MGRLYNIFFIFALIAAASCSQQNLSEGTVKTICATLPDALQSKVTSTETVDDTGLTLSWENSDKLVIVGESVETYSLTAINRKKATFTGKEVQGSVYDVILANSADYENRSYLSQLQTGVQGTEHIEYEACLKGVNSYTDVSFTQNWAQEHGGELLQNGCLLLHFQLPESASTVTQVKVESSSPVFFATNSASSPKSSNIVMNIVKGVIGVDKTVKAYLMTSMQESVIESGIVLRVTVVTDKGSYCKDIVPGKVSIMPGKLNLIKLNSMNWKTMVEHKDFTFMTYNVGQFKKSIDVLNHHSFSEVASIIKHSNPDIVGLNEVLESQISKIDAVIDGDWKYYSAIATGESIGNAIMLSSELNVISKTKIDLPCIKGDYQTRSLGVVECKDFIFCVTHLDHNNNVNRTSQIEKINEWVRSNYENSEKPVILVGDMNAIPTSTEIKNDLLSCWETISDSDMMTYPTSGATKCIDYIFLWKNDALEYRVKETKVITSSPGVDVSLASDHYPVYSYVNIVKKCDIDELKGEIQSSVDRIPGTLIYEEKF